MAPCGHFQVSGKDWMETKAIFPSIVSFSWAWHKPMWRQHSGMLPTCSGWYLMDSPGRMSLMALRTAVMSVLPRLSPFTISSSCLIWTVVNCSSTFWCRLQHVFFACCPSPFHFDLFCNECLSDWFIVIDRASSASSFGMMWKRPWFPGVFPLT